MLNALSGSVLRTVTVGQTPCVAVVDEKTQRVFVANAGSGSISMIDATTGKVLHTVHVGLNPNGIAIDAHIGHVFVTQMGAVSMLDATSGLVLKTIQTMRAPLMVSVDERAGRAFVAGSDDGTLAVLQQLVLRHPVNWTGFVNVLDTRRGTVSRTVAVGRSAEGIAVDERTGHAFVTSFWSNNVSVLDADR